jgi:hypothetical protein
MPIDIRQPNITAPTEAGRLEQIRSYLYQLSEQLNWALNNLESKAQSSIDNFEAVLTKGKTQDDIQKDFNGMKALIIKSADIVEAYSEEINKKLEGLYVAQSDFGEYSEKTSADITANSTNITVAFTDIQKINNMLEGIRESINTEGYIKTGILYYEATTGAAVYGLEIGQTNTINGEETFDKFARFTADRLSFYDSNDVEVAYISDYKLYVTNAEILGLLIHGGYEIDSTDGLAYFWAGRR